MCEQTQEVFNFATCEVVPNTFLNLQLKYLKNKRKLNLKHPLYTSRLIKKDDNVMR